jgi:hypothetical protein
MECCQWLVWAEEKRVTSESRAPIVVTLGFLVHFSRNQTHQNFGAKITNDAIALPPKVKA